jgi:hypothetical protein
MFFVAPVPGAIVAILIWKYDFETEDKKGASLINQDIRYQHIKLIKR